METISNAERYKFLIMVQNLFYPQMDVGFYEEISKRLPKAEKDKDNSALKEFLAGVALIGEYIAKGDIEEKCKAGLNSVNILKKYGVQSNRYFDDVISFCKK
jgi:hypothetical protein